MDAYGTAGIARRRSDARPAAAFQIPDALHLSCAQHARETGRVAINAGSARAFRAPGHPPASFGMESIMDELAVKLDMDPLELRIK